MTSRVLWKTEEDIQHLVTNVATALNHFYTPLIASKTAEQVVIVGVMNGSIFFLVDVLKQLTFPFWLDTIKIHSYDQNNKREPKITSSLKHRLENKHVLLIDDICDSGDTLRFLRDVVKALGATHVLSAVLIQRTHSPDFSPTLGMKADMSAIHTSDNRYIVGYGLDDNEADRNLQSLYFLT